MYLSFYGLNKKPFQNSTNPSFFWFGEMHKKAFSLIKYGILQNQGFILLTGDVGTGKTTLVNALTNNLGNQFLVAKVPDPGLELIDFINYVSHAFEMKERFVRKEAFLIRFDQFLNNASAAGKNILLIIDECQRLGSDLLEEIRQLSNIEKQGKKLLNILFVGQNEFNDVLQENKNRAVLQRISINCTIKPLDVYETGEYVRHRLEIAGAEKDIFSHAAIGSVYAFSGGFPRRINMICDHALVSAFIQGTEIVSSDIVRECAKDLRLPNSFKKTSAESLEDLGSADLNNLRDMPLERLQEIGSTSTRRSVRTFFLVAIAVFIITYITDLREYQDLFYLSKNNGRPISRVVWEINTPNLTNPGKREESQDKYLKTDYFHEKKQENNLHGTNNSELHFETDSYQGFDTDPEMPVGEEGPVNLSDIQELAIENVGPASVVSGEDSTDVLPEVPTTMVQPEEHSDVHSIGKEIVVQKNAAIKQIDLLHPLAEHSLTRVDDPKTSPVVSETVVMPKSEIGSGYEEIEENGRTVIFENPVLSPNIPVNESEPSDVAETNETSAFSEDEKVSINKKTDSKVYSELVEHLTQKIRADLQAEAAKEKNIVTEDPKDMDPGAVIDWVIKNRSKQRVGSDM